jgi:hypothetical protein
MDVHNGRSSVSYGDAWIAHSNIENETFGLPRRVGCGDQAAVAAM